MTSHHKKEKDMIQNKGTGKKKKMNNTQDNSERKFQELVAIKQIKSEQETKYQELRRAPIWEENEAGQLSERFLYWKTMSKTIKVNSIVFIINLLLFSH